MAAAAWCTSIATMRGTHNLGAWENFLYFGYLPSDTPGTARTTTSGSDADSDDLLAAAWAQRRRHTVEGIERSLEHVRWFQELAKSEDGLYEEFTPEPYVLPRDIPGTRFHEDDFLTPSECAAMVRLFERIVVPGNAGEAYGTSQYTTATYMDLKYRSSRSLFRDEERLYWSVRARMQERLAGALDVERPLHAVAAHMTMRNVLPWIGCADVFDCAQTAGSKVEDLIGGMTAHQDGCMWPHERAIDDRTPADRLLDPAKQNDEFYDVAACRRKSNPNWEYPTYTAIVFLNGGTDSSHSGSCSAAAGHGVDVDAACNEVSKTTDKVTRRDLRGGEFAWIDRMSDRFDRMNRTSWLEHKVRSGLLFQ